MIKLSSVRSTGGFSSMSTPPRWVSIASGLSQRAQKTHGPSTSQILLTLVLMMLGGVFVFSNSAYATDISISSSGKVSFGKVQPSSVGTVATAQDSLNITTDCEAGANIYISAVNGSSSGTNLVNNGAISNNTISTVSGTTVGNSNTMVALSDNTWGFNTTENSSSYYGLPAYSEAVSNPLYTNIANDSTVPVYYSAKVTNALTPGTYTGYVLYTTVVNSSCFSYTVSFDKNAEDATGTMSAQSIFPAVATPLTTNAFERPGYIFLGWSTDQNATTPTYTDGQSITDIAPGGGSITLYAVWGRSMQDWATGFGCATLNTNDYLTLYDSRDKNSYVVKKLADNNCWMVQNLRLANYNLTSVDSNVSSNFNLTTLDQNNSTTWCTDANASCYNKKSVYVRNDNNGSIYNWYTATAGTNSNNYDICPKGWRLPTGGSSGEFVALDKAWGGTGANRSGANTYNTFTGAYTTNNNGDFTLAGYISGSLDYVGAKGLWWSSTPYSSTNAYSLGFNSSNSVVNPQSNDIWYYGFSVRCVAQTGNATGWMQDFDPSTLAEGETTTLADKRDGSEYTVKKFGTGNDTEVWMTSNLKLGHDKSYTLTNELTNIPASDSTTYYLPQAGYRGSVTSSSTLSSTNAAAFNTSTGVSEAHVQHRAAGTTDNNTGNPVPEDTSYYNYPAASLGYSYYGQNNPGETPKDICPKGWQLPRGASTSTHSFYWLDKTLGGTGSNRTDSTIRDKFLNSALFSYDGFYYNSTLYNVGSDGVWWSSTVSDSNNAYYLSLNNNGRVNPQHNDAKYYGISIRCIAKPSYTINYDANGGTGEMNPSKAYVNSSSALSSNTFTKDGYYFIGWSTDPSAASPTYADEAPVTDLAPANSSVTLYAIWDTTPVCSKTIHPTATTGCKMADGKIWILGNNGNKISWNNMFTNATNTNNHNATVKSGICPTGYSAPTITDFDNLIKSYNGSTNTTHRTGYSENTGVINTLFGLNVPSNNVDVIWSSTEAGSGVAYGIWVYTTNSRATQYHDKSDPRIAVCYK